MDIVERLRAASDRLCHAAEQSPGDFMSHDANALDKAAALLEEARSVLSRLEPHLDAIVCYASTMDEHEPNRIAFDARALYAKLTPSSKGE